MSDKTSISTDISHLNINDNNVIAQSSSTHAKSTGESVKGVRIINSPSAMGVHQDADQQTSHGINLNVNTSSSIQRTDIRHADIPKPRKGSADPFITDSKLAISSSSSSLATQRNVHTNSSHDDQDKSEEFKADMFSYFIGYDSKNVDGNEKIDSSVAVENKRPVDVKVNVGDYALVDGNNVAGETCESGHDVSIRINEKVDTSQKGDDGDANEVFVSAGDTIGRDAEFQGATSVDDVDGPTVGLHESNSHSYLAETAVRTDVVDQYNHRKTFVSSGSTGNENLGGIRDANVSVPSSSSSSSTTTGVGMQANSEGAPASFSAISNLPELKYCFQVVRDHLKSVYGSGSPPSADSTTESWLEIARRVLDEEFQKLTATSPDVGSQALDIIKHPSKNATTSDASTQTTPGASKTRCAINELSRGYHEMSDHLLQINSATQSIDQILHQFSAIFGREPSFTLGGLNTVGTSTSDSTLSLPSTGPLSSLSSTTPLPRRPQQLPLGATSAVLPCIDYVRNFHDGTLPGAISPEGANFVASSEDSPTSLSISSSSLMLPTLQQHRRTDNESSTSHVMPRIRKQFVITILVTHNTEYPGPAMHPLSMSPETPEGGRYYVAAGQDSPTPALMWHSSSLPIIRQGNNVESSSRGASPVVPRNDSSDPSLTQESAQTESPGTPKEFSLQVGASADLSLNSTPPPSTVKEPLSMEEILQIEDCDFLFLVEPDIAMDLRDAVRRKHSLKGLPLPTSLEEAHKRISDYRQSAKDRTPISIRSELVEPSDGPSTAHDTPASVASLSSQLAPAMPSSGKTMIRDHPSSPSPSQEAHNHARWRSREDMEDDGNQFRNISHGGLSCLLATSYSQEGLQQESRVETQGFDFVVPTNPPGVLTIPMSFAANITNATSPSTTTTSITSLMSTTTSTATALSASITSVPVPVVDPTPLLPENWENN
ncbi:hypothetical protein HDU76_001148, partial [Blyttiomyces sp. JEL0837]